MEITRPPRFYRIHLLMAILLLFISTFIACDANPQPLTTMSAFPGAWWKTGRVRGILEVFTSLLRYRKQNLLDTYPKAVTECFKVLSTPDPNATVADRCFQIVKEEFPGNPHQVLEDCWWLPTNVRHVTGLCNDRTNLWAGSRLSRFGRNLPPVTYPDLHSPEPCKVARLFDRKGFVPAEIINLLAAGWIQFMTHDWMHHANPRKSPITVRKCNEPSEYYWIHPTKCARGTCSESENEVTHWWDASQLYGSTPQAVNAVRTFHRGHLLLHNGDLPSGPRGLPLVGFNENWWVGLHLMHLIFTKEHNSICDRLAALHPDWDDEQLFQQTRVILSAVLAKLHVLEWTKAILRNRVAHIGVYYNWRGTTIKEVFGEHNVELVKRITNNTIPDVLPGAVGGKTQNYGVPFSLTNEFVAVYRMHSLLPDEVKVRSYKDHTIIRKRTLLDMSLKNAAETIKKDGVANVLLTFGLESAGALVLHNYPNHLRNIKVALTSNDPVDLALVEITRDRERLIPRYNDVRRALGLPEARSFLELSGGNASLAAEVAAVYSNSLEAVDLMVGTHMEQPRPPGFGFSDTIFRIFSFMARRRLETDRFFTADFHKETYTKEGLQWIKESSMKSILLRHWPQLKDALEHVTNAFAPWNKAEWQKPLDFTEPWD